MTEAIKAPAWSNMHRFPFNQPEGTKESPSRDCGWRCLWYTLDLAEPYESWLARSAMFDPVKRGITFSDICAVLEHYKRPAKFTQLAESGLFIVYSGVWMKQYKKDHGHYFCYQDGVVLCSTRGGPEPRPLADVLQNLEAKSVEGAFRCLRVG